jgi:hypothetical protein
MSGRKRERKRHCNGAIEQVKLIYDEIKARSEDLHADIELF